MSLQDEIYKRIKEEIANDPMKVGYAGKSDEEIMALLNSPIRGTKVVETYDGPPIARVLNALASAPNIVALTEVTEAKKTI